MGSTLNRTGESHPQLGKGHGTRALGPSDSSDTGSDVVGGPGFTDAPALPLDTGTSEDAATGAGAGRDLGDADLDSDSDAAGTGERGAAGRDVPALDADRRPDRIEPAPGMDGESTEEVEDLADDDTATDGQADDDLPFPQPRDDPGSDGVSSSPRRR